MWTIYQLEKSIAVLTKKTEEAWNDIRAIDKRKGYNLSTPIEVTMADRERRAYVCAWYDTNERLKAAQKQMESITKK